jgi:branched-chain amino acid transport system substrate-binding protein
MARLGLLAVSIVCAAALGAPATQADILIATAAPMTGVYAWAGERFQRGAELAVENLNAKRGVLGQTVELIVGDDFCDPDQAVALARKFVSEQVALVAGQWCSHASIPASKVYEQAKILQIAPGSASAKLTDDGGPNVFRVCGRDDRQGIMVGDYLAEHWADKEIAILDDGTTWGTGVSDGVRRRLRERGIRMALDAAITPGEEEYSALVSRMRDAGVEVFFLGGYHREAGLILRQAHDQGYPVRLIANSAMALEDFPMIAGAALEGTIMAAMTYTGDRPQAREVVAEFQAGGYEPLGYTLYAYAAVQVWAQAVEAAGSLDLDAVTAVLHSRQFDTVLGKIGFDAKGDVTGFEPWQWFVWQADGTYVPLERGVPKE